MRRLRLATAVTTLKMSAGRDAGYYVNVSSDATQ